MEVHMAPHEDDRAPESRAADHGAIQDRRVTPRGVLPRHVQMWVMVAIAVVILAIILLTGHPEPVPRPQVGARAAQPSLVPPDRVRSYEQQLAAQAARDQQAMAPQTGGARASQPAGGGMANVNDPLTDEQRRREYQSLFADNIALSHRPTDRQPYGERVQKDAARATATAPSSPGLGLLQQWLTQNPATTVPRPAAPSAAPASPATPPLSMSADVPRGRGDETPSLPTPPKETGPIPGGGSTQRLLEGTVLETVLLNRLDGTFAGPVDCLVTTPVYSHDRQSVVIPAGARVLGAAAPVQTWGDSRLAVSFHRLVMPDGRTYSLDRFKGLDQSGDTGLTDSVNRHYLQVFGASLAIGALSGLAQYNTRSNVTSLTFGEEYRQAAGGSLATSTSRVLDRYLNVLPTITIREGHRIKVYLTNDLDLPVYASTVSGGSR
jgi:type IV secretory pathway VirB10-like protein